MQGTLSSEVVWIISNKCNEQNPVYIFKLFPINIRWAYAQFGPKMTSACEHNDHCWPSCLLVQHTATTGCWFVFKYGQDAGPPMPLYSLFDRPPPIASVPCLILTSVFVFVHLVVKYRDIFVRMQHSSCERERARLRQTGFRTMRRQSCTYLLYAFARDLLIQYSMHKHIVVVVVIVDCPQCVAGIMQTRIYLPYVCSIWHLICVITEHPRRHIHISYKHTHTHLNNQTHTLQICWL